MSWLNALIPLAGNLLGGLFGGGGPSAQEQAMAQQRQVPVRAVPLESPGEQDDAALIAFYEGWLRDAAKAQGQTTAYDPVAALAGNTRSQPMPQTSNQRGGQAYPGYAGQGLFGGQEKLGMGRGAGGDEDKTTKKVQSLQDPSGDAWWRTLLGSITGPRANTLTGPLQGQFTGYMGQALGGQAGLPPQAYQQALLSGQSTLNAQSQRSREQLGEQLGSRGLLQSGAMARGLRGVEESRQQSMGDLISGLSQQDMQARIEAQRQAAGMFPQLVQAQSGAQTDLARSWLYQQQLELERRRLGLAEQQYEGGREDALWGAVGGVVGGIDWGRLFGGGNSRSPVMSDNWYTGNGLFTDENPYGVSYI